MEISILLSFAIVHYTVFLLNGRKSSVLGCGIIGWAGNSISKFNKQKFDILGLFNNSRGGDSCGVSTDGEIYYGTGIHKNYDDFIVEKGGYPEPLEIPVVIGHMRKASIGAISESNAHPFGFGEVEGKGFGFIGCHNGTLSNHDAIAEKYGIETSVYNSRGIFDRTKGDSEILLETLYTSKNEDVLTEYIGGAAILFQDLTKPNTLYAFHGASKKEVGDKAETLYEERPLYYYQESKNCVYISSMEEALIFIGGKKDKTVFEFEHNILYEIIDGSVTRAKKYEVDRKGAGQRKPYGGVGFTMGGKASTTTIDRVSTHSKKQRRKERSKTKRSKRLENVANIYDETVMEGDFKSAIYYNKLRYWRNGHLINGVFTFIANFGFYKIGCEAGDSNSRLYQLIGEYFSIADGEFVSPKYLEERLAIDDTLIIPFEFSSKEPPVFFFHEGIMLETVHDFVACTSNYGKNFSFEHLSQMSKYPICRMRKNRPANDKQEIIYNGQPYTNNIIPLQSNHCYNIDNGNLMSIDRFEDEIVKEAEICCSLAFPSETPIIQFPGFEVDLPIKEPNNLINAYEKPTVEFMDEDPIIEDFSTEESDKKVLDIINDHIMPVYHQIQVVNEDLKNEENEVIQEIIDLNKEYLISVDCIVESKSKENER